MREKRDTFLVGSERKRRRGDKVTYVEKQEKKGIKGREEFFQIGGGGEVSSRENDYLNLTAKKKERKKGP